MITATCTDLNGELSVTAMLEGSEVHYIVRYNGQEQHGWVRSHEGTQTEVYRVATDYTRAYTDAILRAADERTRAYYASPLSFYGLVDRYSTTAKFFDNAHAEYERMTMVAAQIATESYLAGGLDGIHDELAFLRRSDAAPVIVAEVERLYHRQIVATYHVSCDQLVARSSPDKKGAK